MGPGEGGGGLRLAEIRASAVIFIYSLFNMPILYQKTLNRMVLLKIFYNYIIFEF